MLTDDYIHLIDDEYVRSSPYSFMEDESAIDVETIIADGPNAMGPKAKNLREPKRVFHSSINNTLGRYSCDLKTLFGMTGTK